MRLSEGDHALRVLPNRLSGGTGLATTITPSQRSSSTRSRAPGHRPEGATGPHHSAWAGAAVRIPAHSAETRESEELVSGKYLTVYRNMTLASSGGASFCSRAPNFMASAANPRPG